MPLTIDYDYDKANYHQDNGNNNDNNNKSANTKLWKQWSELYINIYIYLKSPRLSPSSYLSKI